MNRYQFLFAFLILHIESPVLQANVNNTVNMTKITENDVRVFRSKNQKNIIDKLKDLNPKSNDVIGIFEKIAEIQKKGNDMLITVPDNGATCSTKVQYHIRTFIERAAELCDKCVAINVDKDNELELNLDQKNCLYDVLHSAEREIEAMKPQVESCILIA